MTESFLSRYLPLVDNPQALQDCVTQPLPTCIWTNPFKTTPSQLAGFLREQNLEFEPLNWYPDAFRIPGWDKPGDTLAFATGWYYVQEEIALTAVQMLDPQPGDRVLDLCAAPGGKAAQIAIRLAGTGMVVANEGNFGRLPSLATTITRLGLLNGVTTFCDGRTIALQPHSFDRVLVDVPCSGEGTVRKHQGPSPEAKPSQRPRFSSRIVPAQQRLLDRALQLVKPGGVVVYSTCTFAPEENEAVLDAVLGDRGYLEPAEIPGLTALPGLTQWEGQSFRADLVHAQRYFPHFNDTGGFFGARIRRTDTELASPVPVSLSQGEKDSTQPSILPLDDSEPLAWLCDRFGIDRGTFADYQLWTKSKSKIYIAEPACQPLSELEPESIGIRLLRQSDQIYKPTTIGLQRFGSAITRNAIALDTLEAAERFMAGQTQALSTNVEPGYVHVRYGPFELGCGFYRDGQLQSQVPKGLQFRYSTGESQ